MHKTNAMRLLETAGISFTTHTYPVDETDLSGVHAARLLGLAPGQLFKTLVLKGDRTGFFVCCIPADEELDLKKAAAAAGDKNAQLLPLAQLLSVTGYLRGGCSPVGMKKKFPIFFDETSIIYEEVLVSAGERGSLLKVSPERLCAFLGAQQRDLLLTR